MEGHRLSYHARTRNAQLSRILVPFVPHSDNESETAIYRNSRGERCCRRYDRRHPAPATPAATGETGRYARSRARPDGPQRALYIHGGVSALTRHRLPPRRLHRQNHVAVPLLRGAFVQRAGRDEAVAPARVCSDGRHRLVRRIPTQKCWPTATALPAAPASAALAPPAAHATERRPGISVETGSKLWDPLNLSEKMDESNLNLIRAAELKHGRVAMLATVGWAWTATGTHFEGMLSTSKGVSFADLAAASDPIAAAAKVCAVRGAGASRDGVSGPVWQCSRCPWPAALAAGPCRVSAGGGERPATMTSSLKFCSH